MSGVRELHHYQAVCEQCSAEGPVVLTQHKDRAIPNDWGYKTTGGWGMYDAYRTHLYCAGCIANGVS